LYSSLIVKLDWSIAYPEKELMLANVLAVRMTIALDGLT